MSGDDFIKLGFWAQLVILVLVDWGSILAFLNEPTPWYHYVGFTVVNVVLLGITWKTWGITRARRRTRSSLSSNDNSRKRWIPVRLRKRSLAWLLSCRR